VADESEPMMFRPEALEHRARSEVPGGVVRIGPRWADRAFWLLLVLVLAAFVAGTQIRIDRYATGPTAVTRNGRVLILVPASLAVALEPGGDAFLGSTQVRVTSIAHRALGPSEVGNRFGVDVAVPSVAVETSRPDRGSNSGTGRVLIGSDPVLVALVPGLDALLGDDRV
jgi:hypothetical protein